MYFYICGGGWQHGAENMAGIVFWNKKYLDLKKQMVCQAQDSHKEKTMFNNNDIFMNEDIP